MGNRPLTTTVLAGLGASLFLYALLGNYLALPGYIRFLERGRVSAAGNENDLAVILGAAKTILWLFSFHLGLLCLTLAALLKSGAAKTVVAVFLLGALIWLGVAGVQSLPHPPAAFYILFGSAILLLIAGTIHRWAGIRVGLEGDEQRRHDYRLFGYLFFGLAAWDVCGLGSMGLMLHPERAVQMETGGLLVTQSSKVMIEFVLGWVFSWMSLARSAEERL